VLGVEVRFEYPALGQTLCEDAHQSQPECHHSQDHVQQVEPLFSGQVTQPPGVAHQHGLAHAPKESHHGVKGVLPAAQVIHSPGLPDHHHCDHDQQDVGHQLQKDPVQVHLENGHQKWPGELVDHHFLGGAVLHLAHF